MDADPRRAMPSLAFPTAAVGAAGATFVVLLLGSTSDAVRGAIHLSEPPLAGGGVGLALGLLLDRWKHLSIERFGATLLRIVPALLVAGGLVGMLLALISGLEWWRTWIFVPEGAVYALLFTPSCVVIMRASARAGRARLGSLVATADRRTVVSTTAAVIAVSSLAAMFSHPSQTKLAVLAVAGVTGAASLLVLWLLLGDRALARRLEDVAALELEPGAAPDDASAARIDVGLGSGTWLSPPLTPAYRSASRGEILLRGDVDAARAALERERNRRIRTLGLVVAVPPLAALIGAAGVAPG